MSNVTAGIGRGQLIHLDEHKKKKNKIYQDYLYAFRDIQEITMNPMNKDADSNNWLSCITIDARCKVNPNDIMDRLAEQNIESRPIWKPMQLQPIFAQCDFIQDDEKYCVSENIFNNGLCLPSDIKNTREDMDRVIEIVRGCFGRKS